MLNFEKKNFVKNFLLVGAVTIDGTGVSWPGATASADVGGSSKYSSEILED